MLNFKGDNMMTEIEMEFNKCLKDDLDLMCNDAYIVTKDGSAIALEDGKIVQQIKKHIDKFDHFSVTLAYQPYKESFEDTKKTYIETQVKIKKLNNLNLDYWNVHYDLDKMTNDDNTGWQFLCTQTISLKNPQILKGDDKMKLNKEAIDEITYLLNEVKDVVKLLGEFGIHIDSDVWTASTLGGEGILHWKRKDFEEIDEISDGDKFYIGGNVVTASQHTYKNKWIIAPKKLAEVQGEIFEEYLTSVMNSVSLKHFELDIKDEYGLVDNCGWEHWLVIEATVKESAITDNSIDKLLQEIKNEQDTIIELSASPIYERPSNKFFSEGCDLRPKGDFAYMVEFFSDLIVDEDTIYQGSFGVNSRYIKDAMKLITEVENRAKEIADKYADKGVKVTVNGLNDGCEKGMAIYVWIPYQ